MHKLLTVLLAVVFLITTSGFTVFEHHCRTDEITEFSLLVPDFDCKHKGHDHDNPTSCCSVASIYENSSSDDGNCCDIDSYVVRLDITLDIQKLSKKTSDITPVIPIRRSLFTEECNTEIKRIRISNDLPPPLSGRSLIIFLQRLNIPDLSV